jgi:Fur family transcriptional regulator, ferric uptake regulator
MKIKIKKQELQTRPELPGRSFPQLLRERGLKSTRQREVIARVFLGAGAHVSVEEIYRRVRGQFPRIGYATVYRTLKLMAENGWASSRQFGDGMSRFEFRSEGRHHDHLICRECGKIVEFASARIEALQAQVAREQGFRIFDHKLELYGYCARCHSRGEGRSNPPQRKIENG